MHNVHILIDDDHVLNDWDNYNSSFRRLFQKHFPDEEYIPVSQMSAWDYESAYGPELGKEVQDLLYTYPEDFYFNIEPMPGAIEVVKRLIGLYEDVRIVTSPIYDPMKVFPKNQLYWERWFRVLSEKARRLEKWFGSKTPIIIGDIDKTIVRGDILIDDNPNVGNGKLYTPEWTQILFDRGYIFNQGSTHPYRADWYGMEAVIEKVLFDRSLKNGRSVLASTSIH